MKLPSWLLTLPLITLPVGATAQAPDPACRSITKRLIQEALDQGLGSRLRDEAAKKNTLGDGSERENRRASEAAAASEAALATGDSAAPADRAPSADAPAPSRSSRAKDDSPRTEKAKGPERYSRTNTQEDAVDEGDIVKTNGRHIFHVSCSRAGESSGCRDELRIYKTWPAAETDLIGRVHFEDGVQQIYLHGDQVVVLSQGQWSRSARLAAAPFAAARDLDVSAAQVTVLDVADPAHPHAVGALRVEGSMVESRMIGTRLYLATRSPRLALPAALAQQVAVLAASGAVSAEEVLAKLDGRWDTFVSADPGLPRLGNDARTAPIYGCADLTITEQGLDGLLLNVAQIDLSGQVRGAGLTGVTTATTLYASDSAMYVASAGAVPPNTGWLTATHIRKLALDAEGPRFVGQGAVRGTLLNQFSMSEYGGYLRVATTDQWVSNNVYVLRATQGELETVGKLENLGRNERIHAVRMMGDRAYVVTFRRTDPLFTIDLSVPTQPALIGELHIEGFSNYLHPLGKNHLLAIGQDTEAGGRATGFHLQVFDVTDPRRPVRKFHEKLAMGSVSDAETDHHAFFFEPTTQTLSVPWKSEAYWGLVAYRVDATRGFVDLGRVNHALMYKRYYQRQCRGSETPECGKRNHWWTFVTRPAIAVDRLVVIDDQLYSMSPTGVMVHRIGERLTETASVLVSKPQWSAARPRVVSSW